MLVSRVACVRMSPPQRSGPRGGPRTVTYIPPGHHSMGVEDRHKAKGGCRHAGALCLAQRPPLPAAGAPRAGGGRRPSTTQGSPCICSLRALSEHLGSVQNNPQESICCRAARCMRRGEVPGQQLQEGETCSLSPNTNQRIGTRNPYLFFSRHRHNTERAGALSHRQQRDQPTAGTLRRTPPLPDPSTCQAWGDPSCWP